MAWLDVDIDIYHNLFTVFRFHQYNHDLFDDLHTVHSSAKGLSLFIRDEDRKLHHVAS